MTSFRRLVRAKKGMSTIFGALFFIILILMGFNLMLWNFIQYDAYNGVVTSMGQRDQQSLSENLVFNPPGATGFTTTYFNISVNNQGGIAVTVSRIYIVNLSPTSSTQCAGTSSSSPANNPCIIDPTSSTSVCPTGKVCSFTNPNLQTGENSHIIRVNSLLINDGSGYKVVLSTTRGRQFSFFYPWPVNMFGGSNSNSSNTAHGALDVQFDLNSFNFTRGSQTVSQPGWTVPYHENVIYYVKVVNNALQPIVLSKYTSLYFVCYQDRFGAPADQNVPCSETDDNFVVDNRTISPVDGSGNNRIIAYDDVNRPYVLPAAGPNGPNGFTIVKFGSFSPGGNDFQDVDFPTPYLVFMGFFYKTKGTIVGQTISFVAIRACDTYPSCP